MTDPTDPPPSLDADPKGDDGKFIDVEDGQVYPEKLEVYLKEWKRPETLLPDVPTVPVVLLKTPDGDGDDAAESAGDKGNRTLVDEHALYFGNPCVEWLFAAIRNVYERRDTVDAGSLLWENIYPQDDEGIPVASPNGKYLVRMWIMNAWRCVTVDDRVPVDVFGTSLLVGVRPLMLWPILLSKAILKLASRYGCLEREATDDVPVVQWLTGWERECLGVDTTHGHLYDRVWETLRYSKNQALATAFLRERFQRETPPRVVALCGAPGVGKRALLDALVETYPERFGHGVSTTSRPPMEHEVDGRHYWFVEKTAFEEKADSEDGFLERCAVADVRVAETAYHVQDRHEDGKPYLYGLSFEAIRTVSAGGKLLLVEVSLDGVRAMKSNPAVDAFVVHAGVTEPATLRERLRARLKEDESTIQKRLEFARAEWEIAQPGGPAVELADGETPSEPPPPQEKYHSVLLVDDADDLFYQFKVRCAELSPIVRNRLLGLPAYVLDYSDVIPANETEKPVVKPVVLAGPNFLEKADLARRVTDEFPEVFAFPKIVTTRPVEPAYPCEAEPGAYPEALHGAPWSQLDMEHVSREDFEAAADDFAVTWETQFAHETMTHTYGITRESLESAAADEKLCLVNLPSVEAHDAFAAFCASNEATAMPGRMKVPDGKPPLSVFVGPSTIEEHERRLRAWLTESEASLDAMMADAARVKAEGDAERLFDAEIALDGDPAKALDALVNLVSAERPDVVAPKNPEADLAKIPKPIVVCGPSGVGKTSLITMLTEEHPDAFGVVVRHTTRAAEDGEENGTHYHFVDVETFAADVAEGKFIEHVARGGDEVEDAETEAKSAGDEAELAELAELAEPARPAATYGTSREALAAVMDAGKIPILDVDVASARAIKAQMPDGAFVFVVPASVDALEERLRAAEVGEDGAPADPPAEDDEEALAEMNAKIAARLDTIAREMEGFQEEGLFTDVVVNEELELAYADVKTAVARAHPLAVTPPPAPLVVSGPIGSRREETFEALLTEFPDTFGFPLVVTTRAPEENELDGVHYAFVDDETFAAMAEEGRFLECAEVIVGYGEWDDELEENPPIKVMYGTPTREVKRLAKEGKMPVLETDAAGAAAMRAAGLDALYVFFAHPADADEHRRNLVAAGESEDVLDERAEEAEAELEAARGEVRLEDGGEATPLYDVVLEYEDRKPRFARFKEAIATREPRTVPMSAAWGFGRPRWDLTARVYGRRPLRVAVVGPAASGKSTAARELAEKYDVPLVYPGALLREAAYDNPTELGVEAKRYLDSTRTVPDDFMMVLIKERIEREDCVEKGWILDGFPHNHYQAKALSDAGHRPDKVFVLEVDHATVLARTEGRLIDPHTGRVYHKEFVPAEEGSEIAARLTIRHDDLEENVRNRLAKYDFSDAPIRSVYPEVSDYVDGARSPREVLAHMVDFIEIEDRLHDERNITPAMELKSLEYEIRDVCKYRSRCCLLLADPGLVGESRDPPVWVPLEELSRTAKNILANFKPEQFEHARKDERLDLADIGPGGKVTELGKMIHVDSPEPVELLVSLTVAPVEPKPPVPQPATLALCGEGAEELAELLAETYPDIYAVAERQEPEPEKPRTEDADADDAGDDADDANEEQNPTDDGDANEEQKPEDEDENADAAAETASEWTAEAYPGALHAARLRREGLCAVVVLDATETPTFKAVAETADAAPDGPADGENADADADGAARAEAEVAADGEEPPLRPPPTMVCIGMPPKLAGSSGNADADEAQAEGATAPSTSAAAAFDAVLYPTSADSSASLLDTLKTVAGVKVRLPTRDDVDVSVCNAVLHEYDWHETGAPQRTVLALATNTTRSHTVRLPRGRHVLQLSVDPGFYFTANVRSRAEFAMDEPAVLLEARELAAPAVAEGAYAQMSAGDWAVWFRRVFKCASTTVVSAALEVADPAMSPFARFAVVNNDGAGETTHFVAGAAPPRTFEPNEHGYTIMAYSKALSPLSAGRWRLSALADVPFASFEEMPTETPATFEGSYSPNYSHLVCRLRVAVSARALLAFHFETDLPSGLTVTLTDPEEGWETKQAEYLRGGHQGHLRGEELRRWDAYAALTVPALAVDSPSGGYLVLEVKLANARCAFDVRPNGDVPNDIHWKFSCYTSDPNATEWSEDTAREAYFETTRAGWNAAGADREKMAEEALARRAELLAMGADAPPVVKEVVDPADGEEPKQLALEPRRTTRRGGALVSAARAEAAKKPVPSKVDGVVVSDTTYAEREMALARSIEESKARLQAFVATRDAQREARAESKTSRATSFTEWRASTRSTLSESFRAKRAAYLESVKPAPEEEPEEGAPAEEANENAEEGGGDA